MGLARSYSGTTSRIVTKTEVCLCPISKICAKAVLEAMNSPGESEVPRALYDPWHS
jgi:hypothetical protein